MNYKNLLFACLGMMFCLSCNQEGLQIAHAEGSETSTVSPQSVDQVDFYANNENDNSANHLLDFEQVEKPIQFINSDSLAKKDNVQVDDKKLVITGFDNVVLLELIQNPNAGESSETFSYLGYSTLMNKHLIKGESVGMTYYWAFDEVARDTMTFNGYPLVSPDGKYIFDIFSNLHDDMTYLSVYSSTGEQIGNYSFVNWMTKEIKGAKGVWVDNRSIVIPYIDSKSYWENRDKEFTSYVRIKIK